MLEHGKKVKISTMTRPVPLYLNNRGVAYVEFSQIPQVILDISVFDQGLICNELDLPICTTCGNLLCDMEQTEENFEWRERLIDMQMNGVEDEKELEYVYAPYWGDEEE